MQRASLFFIILFVAILSSADDIPAEARAAVLKQQIMDAMKASPPDTNMALDKIAEYRKLKLPMPPPLLFMEGKLAVSTDDPLRAAEALEAYFKVASPDDERYAEAAKMYASVEAEAAPLKEAKIAEQKRQTRIAAERQAQKKVQAEAQAEADRAECLKEASCRSRLTDLGGGVLHQSATGLDWTQSDNGRAIAFRDAKSWCTSKGDGWRLPLEDEFKSILDYSVKPSTVCGSETCKVSPLFHLTGSNYWRDISIDGSFGGWVMGGRFGGYANTLFLRDDEPGPTLHALCVRGP